MKKTMWLVVVLVLGGIIAAGYFFLQTKPAEPPPVVTAPPPPPPPPEPAIKHPIREAPPSDEPLPPLDASDDTLLGALVGFFGQKTVDLFIDTKELARRFVVTVDNLPRKKLPLRYRLFKPVTGHFLAAGEGDDYFTNPDNFRRYKPYILLLSDAVDAKTLVAAYTRYYPLFQQEYVNLGYPKGYFNDRLVEAIDDLLAAPEIPGRIKLVRPKVMYLYADPQIEELSSGQKIMIRMGPENAARIKAVLREIRQELTRQAP